MTGNADRREEAVDQDGVSDEEQAVARYLQAVEAARAAPESFPNPDKTARDLAGAEMLAGGDQEGLEVQLAESAPGSQANVAKLEDDFVRVAAAYGQRHGLTYEGWRQSGVDADVLARAGIAPPEK